MKSLEHAVAPASQAGQSGVLALANENRLEGSTYSEAVTEFVVGVLGSDLMPLQTELDMLAPPVRTARRFEYMTSPAGLSFLADQDDERAIGADFRKLDARGTTVSAKTANRGLSYTLDRDEMVDGSLEQTAKWLTAILLRNDLLRVNAVLAAAATNTNVTFSSSTDPDGLIETGLLAAHGARGIYPNIVVSGMTAWAYRKAAYRASTKAGSLSLAAMTPSDVAGVLGVDKFHVSKTVTKPTKSGSKTAFMSNLIYAYYTDDVVSKDDASNIKRFWTPCDGGEQFRVYVDDSKAKTVEVVVEQYSTIAATDTTGIRKFTVSDS
ncbi:hypothetical protein EGM51_10650 [Verrucomicrobia bacterium S94]|nr:hypothetical protein EGM51_10650 [Verrucomicrobia bacterium S94]